MPGDLPTTTPSPATADDGRPWFKLLTRYHWFVLIVAALGWLFDTMDQQLFVLARKPAITELLHADPRDPNVDFYGNVSTAIFLIGWGVGGVGFGPVRDRIGPR